MVYTRLDLLAFYVGGIWRLYGTVFYPLQLVIFLPLCVCVFGLFRQQSGEHLFQSQLLRKLAWSGQAASLSARRSVARTLPIPSPPFLILN